MQTVRYPVAPPATALRGTLLDAATVTQGIEWSDGRDLFDSYNCLSFGANATFCGPNNKTLDQSAGWQDGVRFAAYGGLTCKAVGLDRARLTGEVERAFRAGESIAVEAALMEFRFVENTSSAALPGEWDAPEDITPTGGPVGAYVGVALLEGYAARHYVGTPTLHVPRSVASMLLASQAAEFSGDVLRTRLGSKIAAGAGYDHPNTGPDGSAATATDRWIYATGEVLVQQGDLQVIDTFMQDNNDVVVLAERAYIATVDCFAAALQVDIAP